MKKSKDKFDHQYIPTSDDPNLPFTPMGCEERLLDYPPMTHKSVSCTKCEVSAASMEWVHCNYRICPVRECLKS